MQSTIFINLISNLLHYDQIYYWVGNVALKKLCFKNKQFEDRHFSNRDKKHTDQIPLLFS